MSARTTLGPTQRAARCTVALVAGTVAIALAAGSGHAAVATGGLTLGAGSTLAGYGAIDGTVTADPGGTVAPGSSVGTLGTAAVAFSPASTFAVEIDGNGSDLLDVTGTVDLTGATLSLSLLAGYVRTPGRVYTIIANDLADAVTGTFAGLPEGAVIKVGASAFKISYVGGTGNDVTLTAEGSLAAPALSPFGQALALVLMVFVAWIPSLRRGAAVAPPTFRRKFLPGPRTRV